MSSTKGSRLFSRSSNSSQNGQAPDFLDYLAIKNVLSLYCVALDTKDFDMLFEVFTDDVEAAYPSASMRGVGEVASHLSRRSVLQLATPRTATRTGNAPLQWLRVLEGRAPSFVACSTDFMQPELHDQPARIDDPTHQFPSNSGKWQEED